MFVNINVILGFLFGTFKTYFRCLYIHISKKNMNFDYDKILAVNILESMRAVNVKKVEDNIASFKWQNIPIVSQEEKIEIISEFEVIIDLKTKQSIHSFLGFC